MLGASRNLIMKATMSLRCIVDPSLLFVVGWVPYHCRSIKVKFGQLLNTFLDGVGCFETDEC